MIETDYILEVNATRHCTNACDHCHHVSTKFTPPHNLKPFVLEQDLACLKNLLRVRIILIQGGEPLLHPEVGELLEVAYYSNVGRQVGVLTNGKLLRTINSRFWHSLAMCQAELRISVYPDLEESIVAYAVQQARVWGFGLAVHTIGSFKAVFQKGDGSSYHGCGWNRCLTVHEGRLYLCPVSAFVEPKEEGLVLEGLTEPALAEFLARQTPLKTCTVCAGTHAPDVPWSQSSTKDQWFARAGL